MDREKKDKLAAGIQLGIIAAYLVKIFMSEEPVEKTEKKYMKKEARRRVKAMRKEEK